MPGTIQVSVLEFKGLPSTSPSRFLRVSMGKKEYQTSDIGDFSFPLTSLRDNLVITLQDAEGNEISHTVIQTISIVEKVLWNDIFQLGGGSQVHLQLQFILSDEERNRIRSMREAAMKKKQGGIRNVIPGQSEIAGSDSDSVILSQQAKQIVSDSPRTIRRVVSLEDASMQVSPSQKSDILYEGSQSNYGQERRTVLEKEMPKAMYKWKRAMSAPRFLGVEAQLHETNERGFSKVQSSFINTRPVSSQEASSKSEYSGPEVAAKSTSVSSKEDRVDKSKQQGPSEKIPSKVRKLVGAFESSRAQDFKSPIKPSAVKPEERKVGKGGYPNDSVPKVVTEAAEPISGRHEPVIAGNLNATGKGGEKIDTGRSFVDNITSEVTYRLEKSTPAVTESKRRDSSSRELAESSSDLEKPSIDKSGSIPGSKLDESSGRSCSLGLSAERQDFGSASYVEGRIKEGSAEISDQVASSSESKSLEYREEELFDFEKYGMWIFPNDRKHLCFTTAGKRVMNLLGSRNTASRSQQKEENSYVCGHVDKVSAKHGTEHEKEDNNKTENLRKSRSESSSSNASGGLVAQAIKVAVVVGFGVLVFLTRQRDPRKCNKGGKEPLFETLKYMDE